MIVTIGFDERLPLRALMRHGVLDGDVIALVYSKTGGEFEVRKVEAAIESLKDVVSKIGGGVVVEEVTVSGSDFYGDVKEVIKWLKKAVKMHSVREVKALLVGGMRFTIHSVLLAVMLFSFYTSTPSMVYTMREDGASEAAISHNYLVPPKISDRESSIIRLIGRRAVNRADFVKYVSETQGISISMVYKVIDELEKKGVVHVENNEVKLTLLGELMYEALG